MEVKKYKMARSWLTDPDSGNSAGQWKNFVQQRKQEWKAREGFKGAGLVDQGPGDVRQGYKGERVYTTNGKRALDLTKEQKKWFNKTHKNNPDSSFYKKDWKDLAGKKSDILEAYDKELAREKPPKGYITTKEFSKKYNFPIHEKIPRGPGIVAKAESNFINNALMKQLESGKKHILTRNFLTETLEPRLFETLLDLGDGRKVVKKVNYVKDDAKLAKKIRTYLDSPFVQVKTRENMVSILKNNEIKTLFNKGDYKGLVKALKGVKGLTNAERANALLRIAQAMSGVSFRDFEHNLKLNNSSANKIFKGLEKAKWGDPYADAYRNLKRTTIKNAIGDEYFTKSYRGFLEDARKALKNAGMDPTILKLDLNEITGLSAGYKNKTFSSTQFVNFMDSKFNQEQHASMIKEYGRYEAKLQSALKGKNPSEARQIIKDWETWRKGWYGNLDPKFQTQAIKDILPSFKLGEDAAVKKFGQRRLNQLLDLSLDVADEAKTAGYLKTFGSAKTMSKMPVLKELASNNPKAIKTTIQLLKNMGYRCLKQEGGGETVGCYARDALNKMRNIKTRGPGFVGNMARLRSAGKNFIKYGYGPLELFLEGVFAWSGLTKGHENDEIWADSLIGMVIPKALGGPEWGDEIRLGKIAKLGGGEYVDALKKEEEFFSFLDEYDLVAGGDPRGFSEEGKEAQLAQIENNLVDWMGDQDPVKVPAGARKTEVDETGEPLWPQNIGPEMGLLKFAADLNPDSFAAEKFRTATEKLVSDQAKQAIPKRILEEQGLFEGEETKKQKFFEKTGTFDFDPVWNPATKTWEPSEAEKASEAKSKIITKSIAEHPRGMEWDTEFWRMLGGWDPVQTGPFRHEGMDYLAGGGMTGIRRPDAVPPVSGPDPQGEGLSYLLNRVKKQ